MEDLRSYRLRGTPDCPIALYWIGYGHNMAPHLHYHPELEFFALSEGQMDFRLDKSVVHMTAGDILIVPPGQIHGLISYTQGAKFSVLTVSLEAIVISSEQAFQKEFVQPMQNNLLQPPTLLQSGHPAYDAAMEALKMLPLCTMHAPNYKLYRYLTVVSLCVAIAPWCVVLDDRMKDSLPGNNAVRRAMLYIHNKYDLPLDLKTIAHHVHLHPNYLCALFKEHTGQTVLQYLTRKRVEAAILLLQDSNLPIEMIAEKSGFRSQCLFFRHFRQITGTTPHAYRKQLRSQKSQESVL